MAVEKAARDFSAIPAAAAAARHSLEQALDEMQNCFDAVALPIIKRRLKKKAKDIKWPQIKSLPSKQ